MNLSPSDVLIALRKAGHSVRRQGCGADARIMIAPAPAHPDDVAAIKANRDGILTLLACEEALAAMLAEPAPRDPFADPSVPTVEHADLLADDAARVAWQAHNARVEARPKEAAGRRIARTKQTIVPKETLYT